MTSSSSGSGARRCSTARTRPATQSSMKGKASTCGRASKCGAVMAMAAAVNSSAGSGLRSRSSRRSSSAKVAANAAAANAVTPPQPAMSKASASRTCDSHSLAIHGWPVKVKE